MIRDTQGLWISMGTSFICHLTFLYFLKVFSHWEVAEHAQFWLLACNKKTKIGVGDLVEFPINFKVED